MWGDPSSSEWPGPINNSTFVPDVCYFKDHREGPPHYHLNLDWYYILAAKLVFVLVYEVITKNNFTIKILKVSIFVNS